MKIDFKNKSTTDNVRVRVVPKNGGLINKSVDELNPTVGINNGELSFCLSPKSDVILGCEGATNTAVVNFYSRWNWKIIIDDFIVVDFEELFTDGEGAFIPINPTTPQDIGAKLSNIQLKLSSSNQMLDGYDRMTFINYNDMHVKVVVQASTSREFMSLDNFTMIEQSNKSLAYEGVGVDGQYEKVSFCLSPTH